MHGQSRWQPGPKRESGTGQSKSRQNGCLIYAYNVDGFKRESCSGVSKSGQGGWVIWVIYTCNEEDKLSTGNEACGCGHHGDFLYGCCSVFHRSIYGLVSKSIHQLLTSISCRACQYYELSASLLELEWSSSTSLHAHTLLPALSWMSVEGNVKRRKRLRTPGRDTVNNAICRASQLASRPGWKPSAWTRAAPCHKAFQKVTLFPSNPNSWHIFLLHIPTYKWHSFTKSDIFIFDPYFWYIFLYPY